MSKEEVLQEIVSIVREMELEATNDCDEKIKSGELYRASYCAGSEYAYMRVRRMLQVYLKGEIR